MNRSYRLRLVLAALLLASALPAFAASAADASPAPQMRIAVIYPQVREPFRSVFRAIADGVVAENPGPTEVFEVETDNNAQAISARLLASQAGAAVLLGKYGLTLSRSIDPSLNRVVGAVFAAPDELPEGVYATSLAPSPGSLFGKLRELAPAVQRISVIYGADSNDWLIELALTEVAASGHTLTPIQKENIRDGASAYRTLLEQLKPPLDALWLPQASPFLNEKSVLQMILRAAWDRNIVVFSSNPSHVPKGALFALFPDNMEMGRHLARVAAESGPRSGPRVEALEQLNTAINIRTADHLGLGLNAADERFDMVFPSR